MRENPRDKSVPLLGSPERGRLVHAQTLDDDTILQAMLACDGPHATLQNHLYAVLAAKALAVGANKPLAVVQATSALLSRNLESGLAMDQGDSLTMRAAQNRGTTVQARIFNSVQVGDLGTFSAAGCSIGIFNTCCP